MAQAQRQFTGCTVDGCQKVHQAKGLCSTHYNEHHQPNRHRKAEVACAYCGQPTLKEPSSKYGERYCDDQCKGLAYIARAEAAAEQAEEEARQKRLPVIHPDPSPVFHLPASHPARRPKKRSDWWQFIVVGSCAWCSQSFSGLAASLDTAPRYCSRKCQATAGKYRRGRFVLPPAVRQGIYERDGWICQLCEGAVDPTLSSSDPWAATLDHVVRQSWGTPDHRPRNLRLAHRWCNSVRGDEKHYTAS